MKLKKFLKNISFKKVFLVLLLSSLILINLYPLAYAQTSKSSTPNKIVSVDGDKYIVNSWEELKELVENGRYKNKQGTYVSVDSSNLNIVINGPIAVSRVKADGTKFSEANITIDNNQTVTLYADATHGATIYGGIQANATTVDVDYRFNSMFNVKSGGTLNVEENVVFSGKRAEFKKRLCGVKDLDVSKSNVFYTPGAPLVDKYIDLSNSQVSAVDDGEACEEVNLDLTNSKIDYSSTPRNFHASYVSGERNYYAKSNEDAPVSISGRSGNAFYINGYGGQPHSVTDINGVTKGAYVIQYVEYDGGSYANKFYPGSTGSNIILTTETENRINNNSSPIYRDGFYVLKEGVWTEYKGTSGSLSNLQNFINTVVAGKNGEYYGYEWNVQPVTGTTGDAPNNTTVQVLRNMLADVYISRRYMSWVTPTGPSNTSQPSIVRRLYGYNVQPTLTINNNSLTADVHTSDKTKALVTSGGDPIEIRQPYNNDGVWSPGSQITGTPTANTRYFLLSNNRVLKGLGGANAEWVMVDVITKKPTNLNSAQTDGMWYYRVNGTESYFVNENTGQVIKGDGSLVNINTLTSLAIDNSELLASSSGEPLTTDSTSGTKVTVHTTASGEAEVSSISAGNTYYFKNSSGQYLTASTGSSGGASWSSTADGNNSIWKYTSITINETQYDNVLVNEATNQVVYKDSNGVHVVKQDKKVEPEGCVLVNPSLKINNSEVRGQVSDTEPLTTSTTNTYAIGVYDATTDKVVSSLTDGSIYFLTIVTDGTSHYDGTSKYSLRADENGCAKWNNQITGTNRGDYFKWKYTSLEINGKTYNNVFYNEKTDQVIYVNEDNEIEIVDKDYLLETKYETNEPALKIGENSSNATKIYANNIFTTDSTSGTYIGIYEVDSTKPNHVGAEATSTLDPNKTYFVQTKVNGTEKRLRVTNAEGSSLEWGLLSNTGEWTQWKYKDGKLVNENFQPNVFIYFDGTSSIEIRKVGEQVNETEADNCTLNPEEVYEVKSWTHGKTALPSSQTDFRGYFIHATDGGNVNINGGVFKDLKTDSNVFNYAPIAIDDSNFNMTSGSIENNRVGYIANDDWSGMQAQGWNAESNASGYNGVEDYIKRTDMTNTAGGIIFCNGAVGSITGDSNIKQNHGDAGGIIVTGKGTDVTLGGSITGTIDTTAEDPYENVTLNPSDGGHINQNVGFHHAGAALVENGATLRMLGENSTMNENVTWAKGGAVWATDFGTGGYAKINYKLKKLDNPEDRREPGRFIMKNGLIDNNTAFLRGGGINVESNKVHLLGGTISNNNSRVLGGGIYVEGDFPDYTYTLVLDKGYIGHNYAVRYWNLDHEQSHDPYADSFNPSDTAWDNLTLRELNDRLDRKLFTEANGNSFDENGNPLKGLRKTDANGEFIDNNEVSMTNGLFNDGGNENNTYFAGQHNGYNNRTADTLAFPRPHQGNGGGVWLCPIGGTAVFHMNTTNEVIIDDNYASGEHPGDETKGTDIYLHSGTGHLMIANAVNEGEVLENWINEKTGQQIPENGTYSGPLYLVNTTNSTEYNQRKESEQRPGINIIHNISRDGGGIGANGTLMFGAPKNVYRHDAQLSFTKLWPQENPDRYPVEFKMYYIDENNKEVELPNYGFRLNGTGDDETTYQHSPEYTAWKASTTIPISIDTTDPNSGAKRSYPLYKLKYSGPDISYVDTQTSDTEVITVATGEVLDPSTIDGMKKIYAVAHQESEDHRTLEIVDWKIVLKEFDQDGKEIATAEFSDISSKSVLVEKDDSNFVEVIDAGGLGKKAYGYSVNFSSVVFDSEARNGKGPQTEKYINNKVHENLVSFDETFEYSIMAYVPIDASEVVIEDTLQEPLMFVSAQGNPEYLSFDEEYEVKSIGNSAYVHVPTSKNGIKAGWYYLGTKSDTEALIVDGYLENPNITQYNQSRANENTAVVLGKIKAPFVVSSKSIKNNDASTSTNTVNMFGDIIANNTTTGFDLVIEETNNHKGDGTGTVRGHLDKGDNQWWNNHPERRLDAVIDATNPTLVKIGYIDQTGTFVEDANGDTIRVTLTKEILDNHAATYGSSEAIRGKWIVLSFDAAIKPEYRSLEKLKEVGWVDDSYNKKGTLPATEEVRAVNDIINALGIDNVEKIVHFNDENVGNLYYAKVKDNGNTVYYVRAVNGDGRWYKLGVQGGSTTYEALDGIKRGAWVSTAETDTFGNALSNLDNAQRVFTNQTYTEVPTPMLLPLDEYLAAHNDYVVDARKSNEDGIERYFAISNKGDLYQMNVDGDGYWYKTTKYSSAHSQMGRVVGTTLNPDNIGKFTGGTGHENDGSGKLLLGYNMTSWVFSQAKGQVLDLDELRSYYDTVGYNYPVIQALEPHSGEMNEGFYTVSYPRGGKYRYKTNVVTIDVLQPEKYVNDKVHDVLRHDTSTKGSFDQPFEYEIMVYVPQDAEEIIIYDTLRDDLMFVDRHGKTQYKTYTIGTSENKNLEDIPNDEFMVARLGDANVSQSMVSNTTAVESGSGWAKIEGIEKVVEKHLIEKAAAQNPESNSTYRFAKDKNGNYYAIRYRDANAEWFKIETTDTQPSIQLAKDRLGEGGDRNGFVDLDLRVTSQIVEKMLETYDTNDHKGDGNGTVSKNNGTPLNEPITAGNILISEAPADPNNVTFPSGNNKAGNTIYLKIDADSGIENVQGKWVKFTFDAQIKPSKYAEVVGKIKKANRHTYDSSEAVPGSSPAGYEYRLDEHTSEIINALDASKDGYYEKDVNGEFTVYTKTEPSGTLGTDYIQAYIADYTYYVDKFDALPPRVQNNNTLYRAIYLRNGWDDTDPNISWEKVTDDGYVLDGEKLYNENDIYKYIGVQEDGSHAGLANNANYAVKLNNNWHYTTTNTVTVVPLLRTLTFNKAWIVDDIKDIPTAQELKNALHLYWERIDNVIPTSSDHGKTTGEITELYKDNISITAEKIETSNNSIRYTWKIEIIDLPQLRPSMKYYVEEDLIEGFEWADYINPEDAEATEHAHDKGTIINSEETKPEETYLLVTKKWDVGGTAARDEISGLQIDVQLMATYNGKTYPVYERDSNDKVIFEENTNGEYILGTDGNYYLKTDTLPTGVSNAYESKYYSPKVEESSIQSITKAKNWFHEFRPISRFAKDVNGKTIYELNPDGTQKLDEDNKPIPVEIEYSIKLLSDPEGYILSTSSKKNTNYHLSITGNLDKAYKYEVYSYPDSSGKVPDDRVKGTFKRAEVVAVEKITEELIKEGNSSIWKETSRVFLEGNELETELAKLNAENKSYFEDICDNGSKSPQLPSTGGGNHETRYDYACYYQAAEEYDSYEVDIVNTEPQIEKYINKDVHLDTYYENDFIYDIIVYVPDEATEIEITDELLPSLKLVSFLEPQVSGGESRVVEAYKEHTVTNMPETMQVAVHAENNHNILGTVDIRKNNVTENTVSGSAKSTITVNGNSFKVKLDNIVHYGSDYIEYPYGEYVKVADAEGKNIQYVKANAIPSGYLLRDNLRYRKVNEQYYVEDNQGTYWYIYNQTTNDYRFILSSESMPNGYSRVGDKTYSIHTERDQSIGGRYVQVTFKARFNLNDETKEAMKAWVENSDSKITANSDLDWDVITTYNPGVDGNNKGWDGYINSLGLFEGTNDYISVPVANITKLIKNGEKYYAAKDSDGNYYVYPMNLVVDNQYNNQWFRVVAGPNYYRIGETTPVKTSPFDSNNDYWFQGQSTFIREMVESGENVEVPIVIEDTYYKEIENSTDRYYLDWVVNEYAGEKKDTIIANGTYKKVDWGRGDGDVIRTYPNNFLGDKHEGDHAGIVNTASYEVTYGNGYKSNHKSNTVTVVPHIYELPSSGGIGTYLFNILGATFISLALFEFTFNKKRKRKEKEGGISV